MTVFVPEVMTIRERNLDPLRQALDCLEDARRRRVLLCVILIRRGNHQFSRQVPLLMQPRREPCHERRVPARMHHQQVGQLQPEREGQEPVDDLGMQRRLVLHFGQEGGVLLPVLVLHADV